jgi:hypothetical protein
MKTLFSLLIILELFCSTTVSKAQHISKKMKFDIGISIDQKSFDNLTKKELAVMQSNRNIGIKDIINIIRIDNTIRMDELIELKSMYNNLDSLLDNKYGKLFVNRLNARWSKGGAFYIKKYNIYWGGTPHQNSMFKVK